jgi:HTH-type transcriptional regulator/antitoxin HigA
MLCQVLCPVAVDNRTLIAYKQLVPDQSQLFSLKPNHPGKMLRQFLDQRGWTQEELASITGKRRQTISDIVSGNSGITPDMALIFAAVFGNTAEEWLRWDGIYRLSVTEADATDAGKRARLYSIAPIREMQKREWIRTTDDLAELENELKRFFGVESLDEGFTFPLAAHGPVNFVGLSPAETAWCFRAKRMAEALSVTRFDAGKIDVIENELRELAAYPKEARHLPVILGEHGIRFVVVEPLTGGKIDGAAFWLNETSPVIAMSIRHDRIDAFWFTLMHEWAHIKNCDALSVDTDLIDPTVGIMVMLVQNEAERRASEEASAALIPTSEMDSFVSRVGPLYSKERIIQFAHKTKIHPGIIVGQLQHRNEIGYSANREMLVKIRAIVIESALTDGWNKTITPGLL